MPNACAEIFFAYDAATHVLTVNATGAPKGNLNRAQAYWVTEDTIAWEPGAAARRVTLHYDAEGDLVLGTEGVTGGIDIPLTRDPAGLPADVREKFPHLAEHEAFKIPADRLDEVPEALRGQLAVSAKTGDGTLVDATVPPDPGRARRPLHLRGTARRHLPGRHADPARLGADGALGQGRRLSRTSSSP